MCPNVVHYTPSLHFAVAIHLRTTAAAPRTRLPVRRAGLWEFAGGSLSCWGLAALLGTARGCWGLPGNNARCASCDRVCWGLLGTACYCSNSCVPGPPLRACACTYIDIFLSPSIAMSSTPSHHARMHMTRQSPQPGRLLSDRPPQNTTHLFR